MPFGLLVLKNDPKPHIVFSPDNDYERRLPRDKLYVMCKYEPVQKYVRKSDYQFYQALVEVLIPDVLRPIPSKLFIYHDVSKIFERQKDYLNYSKI